MHYGNDGGQASLLWSRLGQQNDIRLVGPWGKGLVRLNFNPDSAQLTDDSGQIVEGDDAATLLYRSTGWLIPVSKLDTWVTGMPQNADARIKLDKYGRLKSLYEAGWKIDYQEYRQFGTQELPRKLTLSRQEQGGDMVSVRLVIGEWKVTD